MWLPGRFFKGVKVIMFGKEEGGGDLKDFAGSRKEEMPDGFNFFVSCPVGCAGEVTDCLTDDLALKGKGQDREILKGEFYGSAKNLSQHA